MSDRRPAGGAEVGRGRTVAKVIAIVVVPVIAAYAVLWIGGAAEVAATKGSCTVLSSVSSMDTGESVDRWVGGGVLGRPGAACVVRTDPQALTTAESPDAPEFYETAQLTHFDVIAAVLAALAFVGAAVGVAAVFRKSK